MARNLRGGWRIGLVITVLAALLLSGCDAPVRAEQVAQVDRVRIEATIDASGTAKVTSTYALRASGPESLRIDAPPGGSIEVLDINGNPQRAGADSTDVTLDGPESVVHARLVGVVARTEDSALVQLGLWRQTGHAALSVPKVPVDVTVHLPPGAEPNGPVRSTGVMRMTLSVR